MLGLINRRLRREDGIGIVMALVIAFIVISLGATWYSLSIHELDEVSFQRNRSQAFNAAEAGAREAMALLAKNIDGFRDDADAFGVVTSGIDLGGNCEIQPLETVDNGATVVTGEYWVQVTHLGGLDYQIESWGWSPTRTSRQSVHRKVDVEIELIPLGGFKDALFAATGGLIGTNFKHIYGTAYSGNDVIIANSSRLFENDPGYPGDGTLNVYGDLTITAGANVEFYGDVNVQGSIRHDKAGGDYFADVLIRNDPAETAFANNYFKKATVHGELKMAGTLQAGSNVTALGGAIVEGATNLDDVPQIPLPTYTYLAADYPGYNIYVHADLAAAQAWINANSNALEGVHHVLAGGGTIDFKNTVFVDHFLLVVEGSFTMRGTPADGSEPGGGAATAVILMNDPAGELVLGQSANSIPEKVHHLIFSKGKFSSTNQTTIYGAIYGEEDATANRLEIHFRPPEESIITGFEFDPSLADRFIPEPHVWQEVPPADTPIGAICTP